MSVKDKRKTGPTRKQKDALNAKPHYKGLSLIQIAAFNAGYQTIPSHRCIDLNALRDAIEDCREYELEAMIKGSKAECWAWLDIFAARYPADKRWDDFRAYRKHVLAVSN